MYYMIILPICLIIIALTLVIFHKPFYYTITNLDMNPNYRKPSLKYNSFWYNHKVPTIEYFTTKLPHYSKYIQSIDKNMYQYKVPIYNNTGDFSSIYSSCLVMPTPKYIPLLQHYIWLCNNILSTYPHLNKYSWNILMSIHSLERDMPFTIDTYIIIPESTLQRLYTTNGISKQFINTLIHEKIHVIQRYNQSTFDSLYLRIYSDFLYKPICIKSLPSNIAKIYMTNPDSNSTIWIYKINNIQYIPLLIKTNNGLREIAYNMNTRETTSLDVIKKKFGFSPSISFYHPNEIYASHMTEQILKNKLL